MIDFSDLQARFDFEGNQKKVHAHIERAQASLPDLIRFLGRYTAWNSVFGASVASLAGRIGRHQEFFLDEKEPVPSLADRSVFVASFFFDAARDEFDDRDIPERSTHRCLAQATIKGLIGYAQKNDPSFDATKAESLVQEPDWLRELKRDVVAGYGLGADHDRGALFSAMGFHLGSEVLADQEFSVFDQTLTAGQPDLVAYLKDTSFAIADETFRAYAWLGIHSGHGGGVEADHFDYAIRGVRHALGYSPASARDELRSCILKGFDAFAKNHEAFFAKVA